MLTTEIDIDAIRARELKMEQEEFEKLLKAKRPPLVAWIPGRLSSRTRLGIADVLIGFKDPAMNRWVTTYKFSCYGPGRDERAQAYRNRYNRGCTE